MCTSGPSQKPAADDDESTRADDAPAPASAVTHQSADPGQPNEKGREPLFALGRLVATPESLAYLASQGVNPLGLVSRHCTGDFGELDAGDVQANKQSIQEGSRILSAYRVAGTRIYVITEAVNDDGERWLTTVLLASEY